MQVQIKKISLIIEKNMVEFCVHVIILYDQLGLSQEFFGGKIGLQHHTMPSINFRWRNTYTKKLFTSSDCLWFILRPNWLPWIFTVKGCKVKQLPSIKWHCHRSAHSQIHNNTKRSYLPEVAVYVFIKLAAFNIHHKVVQSKRAAFNGMTLPVDDHFSILWAALCTDHWYW